MFKALCYILEKPCRKIEPRTLFKFEKKIKIKQINVPTSKGKVNE